MAIGDVYEVDVGDATDLYYLDTGMYDVPAYGAVYIIDAGRPALVDTGIGTHHERILGALDRVGLDPADVAVIAVTHVHLDHAGGAGFLAAPCPNATIMTHHIGAPHLVDPERLVAGTKRAVGDQWRFYVEPKPVPADRIQELADGDVIDLGDRVLEVSHTPGHAPHHTVFFDPDAEVLFTGDAAGIWIPRLERLYPTTPPPGFDLEQSLDDLGLLVGLDPAVLCFGHFGPTPHDGKLDTYKRLLTEWVDEVDALRREMDREELIEYLYERDDAADAWGERKARDEMRGNVDGVLLYLERRDGSDRER